MEVDPFYYESMLKYGLGEYLKEYVKDLPENSLEYAVQSGDEAVVIWLLEEGFKWTPMCLVYATAKGHQHIIKLAEERGLILPFPNSLDNLCIGLNTIL